MSSSLSRCTQVPEHDNTAHRGTDTTGQLVKTRSQLTRTERACAQSALHDGTANCQESPKLHNSEMRDH
eukprot:2529010-Prymnesium_polylepis.1